MSSSSRPLMRRALIVAIALATLWSGTAAADVDTTGAYVTSVPITVAPYHGIEPRIALSYSSRSGNGLAGVGWRLAAGSTIRRVSAGGGSPRFDADDRFEVDGARLLPCQAATPGPSCAHGGKFAFAAETSARVVPDDGANQWTITSPDGTVRTYHAVLSRAGTWQTTTTWMLATVRERGGHEVSYENWCDGDAACYPRRISYGEGKACGDHPDVPIGTYVPGGVVELFWEPRPDVIEHSSGGERRAIRYRLRSIDVRHGLGRLRTYVMAYAQTAMGGASVLTQVEQYGEDAVVTATGQVLAGTRAPTASFGTDVGSVPTLAAPSAAPGGGALDLSSVANTALPSVWPTRALPVGRGLITADVDGDRLPDGVSWTIDDSCTTLTLHTRLAGAASYSTATLPWPTPSDGNCAAIGNRVTASAAALDGDGRADLLFSHAVWIYEPTDVLVTYDLISVLRTHDGSWTIAPAVHPTTVHHRGYGASECTLGDLDGDGRTDQVCTSRLGTAWEAIATISVGGGRFQTVRLGTPGFTDYHFLQLFDVDGDRRDDLVVVEQHDTGDADTACSGACPHWAFRVGRSRGTLQPSWEYQDTSVFASFGPSLQRIQARHGDVDGDGRTDLVIALTNVNGPGGAITVALNRGRSSIRWTLTSNVNTASVRNLQGDISLGDTDGDGADDLMIAQFHATHAAEPARCNVAVGHEHQFLITARSNRNGTFALPTDVHAGCTGVETDWRWNGIGWNGRNASAADTNADGRADWLTYLPGNNDTFVVTDRPASHGGPRPGSLHPGDLDGDGRTDWVVVGYLNPGIDVIAAHTQADGSVRQRRTFFSPSALGESMAPDRVRDWFFVDVGSVGGGADGHDDLVVIDAVTGVVTTLLSTGDGGWVRRVARHGLPTGAELPIWRILDADGDGMTDLVNLAQVEFGGQTQVRASVLRAAGDGAWVASSGWHFQGVADPAVAYFQATDIDGDGRGDLVHVAFDRDSNDGNNTQIRVLRSRGDGHFDELASRLAQPRVDATRYRPVDLDGDGHIDLAMIQPVIDQAAALVGLVSQGDGTFVPRVVPISGALSIAIDDWAELRFADLDRDGRADLVHLTVTPQNTLGMTIGWNRGSSIEVQYVPSVSTATRALAQLHLLDVDSDGDRDVVHAASGLVRWPMNVPRTLITRQTDELGARTEIGYGTSVGKHALMPSGSTVDAVTGIMTFDGRSPTPIELIRYEHESATHAFAERRFLGFRWRAVHRARGVAKDTFDLDPRCGSRLTATELWHASGQMISRSTFRHLNLGPADEPTACVIDEETHWECEGEAKCRRTGVRYTHDVFGNQVRVHERGDLDDPADDRMVETTVVPNTSDYVLNLPASITRSQAEATWNGWGWRLLSERRFVYDENRDHLAPPGPRGQLVQRQDWDDVAGTFLITGLQYDKHGNLLQINGAPTPHAPDGAQTTLAYDCTFERFPVLQCDALHCQFTAWDVDHLRPTSVTDPNLAVTSKHYDALGRIERIDAPDGRFVNYRYPDPSTWGTPDQQLVVESSDGSSDGVLTKTELIDGLGRTYRTLEEGGRLTEVRFDGASTRVAASSVPTQSGTPSQWTETEFDAANRPIQVRLPDGNRRLTSYRVGAVAQVSERGATRIAYTDGHGRVAQVEEVLRSCLLDVPENCPSESYVTSYGYDGADRLVWIRDHYGNWTVSSFDSMGRRRAHCSPDGGCETVEFAADGLPTSFIDITGAHRDVTYDLVGRPLTRTTFDASGNKTRSVEYGWDVDPSTGLPEGASLGRLVTERDVGEVSHERRVRWSATGEPTSSSQCIDGNCIEMAFEHDPAGRMWRIVYPDGSGAVSSASEIVTYTYGDDGRLQKVSDYIEEVMYDEFGAPARISFANGVTEHRKRDPRRGWTTGVHIGSRTQELLALDVGRDPTGSVTRLRVSGVGYAQEETYRRDDLGRLREVVSSDPASSLTMEYDAIGRMIADSQRGFIDYADKRHVHAMTSTQAGGLSEYDDRGQLVRDDRRELRWNADGHLIEVVDLPSAQATQFAYASDGQRLAVTTAGKSLYTFNGLVELDPADGMVTHVEALGRLIARRDASHVEFLHADHLGTVRAVTDERGDLVEETDFDAWGRARYVGGSARTTRGFVGGRSEEMTGLVYLQARYLDPAQARMVSADSVIPDPFTPQTLNPYAFVMNDPVTLIDPTGHSPEDPSDEWLPYPEPGEKDHGPGTPGTNDHTPAPHELSVEEYLGRNGPYAGLTPEQRAVHEFWDADNRVGDWIGTNVMPYVAGFGRIASILDPTGVALDAALNYMDENMGWGDSADFVGGRAVLDVAGLIGPAKLGKFFMGIRDLLHMRRVTSFKFDGILKIKISLSKLQAGEKRLIQQKYAMANRLVREGTLEARAGVRVPYNSQLSRQYVKYFDDLPTAASNVRIPKGTNVDEYVSRYFGGPQLMFNQHMMPALLNQSLGSWEQAAVRSNGVLDGDIITSFFIEWTK